MNISSIILSVVLVIVGAVVVWLIVELALTVRKARATVDNVSKKLDPTLDNVEKITTNIQPVITKIDPLVERVSLTVDAANLEIMRVDEILEDVGQITGGVSKAVTAVDNVTNAPLDLVTSVTKKVRNKFSPKYASEESKELGEKNAEEKPTNPIVNFVDEVGGAANEAISEQRAKSKEAKQKQETQYIKAEENREKLDDSAANLINQVSYQISLDTLDPDALDNVTQDQDKTIEDAVEAFEQETPNQTTTDQDEQETLNQTTTDQEEQDTTQ